MLPQCQKLSVNKATTLQPNRVIIQKCLSPTALKALVSNERQTGRQLTLPVHPKLNSEDKPLGMFLVLLWLPHSSHLCQNP